MSSAIALISDIHGNLPALRAVVEDARLQGVNRFLNLGDILYGPLWPRETFELLQGLDLAGTIRGNDDRAVYEDGAAGTSPSLAFVRQELSADAVEWLRGLPFALSLREPGLHAFHASPLGDDIYICEDIARGGPWLRPEAEIAADLHGIKSPLIVFGHSHFPRCLRLRDGRTLVNPGSVGLPAYWSDLPLPHRMETGSPNACYAIVQHEAGGFSARLASVPYDHASAAARARRNGREDWAGWLETGRATRS
jgi:predicted phosphodiesterase